VAPTNLYGFTKAVGEKLTIQANNLTKDMDFVCIRGGNVLGSNGSVVPLFINQIKKKNKITITDGTMTRYFLTLPQAIHLLFQAAIESVGGETYVMNMPAFYISDVAKALIEHYGNIDTVIEEIGIREGEKADEELISIHESKRAYKFNDDYYVIMPDIKTNRNYQHINRLEKVSFDRFSSADNIKDIIYLKDLLSKGGFLN
jgi:FlaA1/EpsC-like NDP-sugar epimerase